MEDSNCSAVELNELRPSMSCRGYNDITLQPDYDDYKASPFFRAFEPLLFSLRVFGLFHIRKRSTPDKTELPSASKIYNWTITALVWLMVIRSFASLRLLHSINSTLLYNLVMTCLLILCGTNAIAFLLVSNNDKSVRKFFTGFQRLNKYGGPFMCPVKMKKTIMIGTTICWACIIVNICLTSLITFTTTALDILSSDPFLDAGSVDHLIIQIVFIFVVMFLTATWIFPSGVELCIAILLYKEFSLFRKSFSSQIADDGRFLGSLEKERCRFVEMCRITAAADDILAPHHGASFACNIISICLLLYSLVYYPSVTQSPALTSAYVFWLFGSFTDMIISCFCGIIVNSAVRNFAVF